MFMASPNVGPAQGPLSPSSSGTENALLKEKVDKLTSNVAYYSSNQEIPKEPPGGTYFLKPSSSGIPGVKQFSLVVKSNQSGDETRYVRIPIEVSDRGYSIMGSKFYASLDEGLAEKCTLSLPLSQREKVVMKSFTEVENNVEKFTNQLSEKEKKEFSNIYVLNTSRNEPNTIFASFYKDGKLQGTEKYIWKFDKGRNAFEFCYDENIKANVLYPSIESIKEDLSAFYHSMKDIKNIIENRQQQVGERRTAEAYRAQQVATAVNTREGQAVADQQAVMKNQKQITENHAYVNLRTPVVFPEDAPPGTWILKRSSQYDETNPVYTLQIKIPRTDDGRETTNFRLKVTKDGFVDLNMKAVQEAEDKKKNPDAPPRTDSEFTIGSLEKLLKMVSEKIPLQPTQTISSRQNMDPQIEKNRKQITEHKAYVNFRTFVSFGQAPLGTWYLKPSTNPDPGNQAFSICYKDKEGKELATRIIVTKDGFFDPQSKALSEKRDGKEYSESKFTHATLDAFLNSVNKYIVPLQKPLTEL